MALQRIVPPLDFLREASPASLQNFELSRLNHAANIKRQIGALLDKWIEETAEAMLARWMLDHRNSLQDEPLPDPDFFQTFLDPPPPPRPGGQSLSGEMVPAPPRFADLRQSVNRAIDRKAQKQRSSA